MKTIKQQLEEHQASTQQVINNLADALIYIDTLHERINECGSVVEDVVFDELPDTLFNYENAVASIMDSPDGTLGET